METARDQSLISNGNDLGKDTEKQEATGKINLNGLSRAVDNAMQGNGNGFPLEVFPETIQELIHSGKETVGYNKDYFSAGILSACATALGNSAQLHNGEYESKPIFWVSVIGSKGTVKTHSLKIAKKPIKEQDSQTYLKYESAMQEYEQLDKDAQGKKPKYSKFILENFTPEKLAEALQYNEKGVLIYRDELMGWINSFDQYKKGGDQQMYLELFNGNELTVDRVTKDPIRIEQTNVNILGGMQPKLLKQFAKNNRDVDGFLDRFLFVIPKNLEPRLFTGKHIPEVHIKNYEKLINNLLEAEPQTIQANASNIELYKEWQHKKVREHFNDTLELSLIHI